MGQYLPVPFRGIAGHVSYKYPSATGDSASRVHLTCIVTREGNVLKHNILGNKSAQLRLGHITSKVSGVISSKFGDTPSLRI